MFHLGGRKNKPKNNESGYDLIKDCRLEGLSPRALVSGTFWSIYLYNKTTCLVTYRKQNTEYRIHIVSGIHYTIRHTNYIKESQKIDELTFILLNTLGT